MALSQPVTGVKITDNECQLLESLTNGARLASNFRPGVVGNCIRKGLAMKLGTPLLTVVMLTDRGRAAIEATRKGS